MPKIPQVQSSVQLTKRSPNRLVDAASFQVPDNTGDILSEQGKTLQAAGEHFRILQNTQETTAAEVGLAKGALAIETEAENDPDIWNAAKTAQDKFAKLKSELASKITSGDARADFEARFDINSMNHIASINNILRTKQHYELSATAMEYIDTKKEEYYIMRDPTIITQMGSKVDELVNKGAWNKEEAYKYWKNKINEIRTGQVDFDADRDLQGTYNELKKGKDGLYPDLTAEERSKLIDSTGKKIHRDQIISAFQDNKVKDENEAKMLVKWADGNLTEQEVKNGLLNMGIRRPFAEKMFAKLYDNPTVETDYSTYVKIRSAQVAGASTNDIAQAILDNSSKLSASDKKRLIDKSFSETDKQLKSKIKYNADALKIWSIRNLSTPKNDLSDDVVYEFHRRIDAESAQGGRVDEISQEVIKDKIKENVPTTALMADVPNFVAERNNMRRVFEKNSKLKGKAPESKPITSPIGSGVDFDDL